MRLLRWGVGLLAAGTLFAAGFLGVIAFGGTVQAQEDEHPVRAALRSIFGDGKFEEKVAQKLGVSVDTLRKAVSDARSELLQQAVSEGKITQAQADRMAQAPAGLRFHGGFGKVGGPALHGLGGAHDAAANALGITPDALRTEMRAGKSLTQIAQERGVNPGSVKVAIVTAQRAAITQAVQNGRITQERADGLLANIDTWATRIMEATPKVRSR